MCNGSPDFKWWISHYTHATRDETWLAVPQCNPEATLLNKEFKQAVEYRIAKNCPDTARIGAYSYIVFDNEDDLALAILAKGEGLKCSL